MNPYNYLENVDALIICILYLNMIIHFTTTNNKQTIPQILPTNMIPGQIHDNVARQI
jgi:hypothetical protein